MLNELPLELLILVLSPLNVSDKIKFRIVCKKWKFAIDQYLLKELNIFDDYYIGGDIFLKQIQAFSNPKNSIICRTKLNENGEWQNVVNLEKIKFLLRNARKLLLYTSVYNNSNPMTDFISEQSLTKTNFNHVDEKCL